MERLWNFETWKLDMELECHNVYTTMVACMTSLPLVRVSH